MSDLAYLGGAPAIDKPIAPYPSLGDAEVEAVTRIVRSGCLSGFFGSWEEGFLGGPEVQAFEAEWSARFEARNTVSVNSATSGLMVACGAVGVSPGDEVIVPSTTMSATAMAPMVYGGIPVFADLDENTFCLSVETVKANLTDRTRAVLAVNLFGQAAPLTELRALCDERGIYLIEDNAQGPLATENGYYCGTIGHIGVFSLNYHKHIHSGEGGMITTEDDFLAERMRMIRNHAEAVAGPAGVSDFTNMLGFNFRLTEMSAAVGRVQLANIDAHVSRRERFSQALTAGTQGLEGLRPPPVRPGCRHVYYVWAMRCEEKVLGVSRDIFYGALAAEGVPCFPAYVAPLYQLPIFQKRVAIGRDGWPFTLTDRTYESGLCPVAERLYEHEIIGIEPCAWDVDETDAASIAAAIRKVHAGRAQLANYVRNDPGKHLP